MVVVIVALWWCRRVAPLMLHLRRSRPPSEIVIGNPTDFAPLAELADLTSSGLATLDNSDMMSRPTLHVGTSRCKDRR
jgi:hypothetical protein